MPIIPNQRSAAAANRKFWSDQNAACKSVSLPVGTIYIDGTVTTPAKYGCGVLRSAGGTAVTPVDNHPTLTGALTRVVQVGKGPCLRLSGAGYHAPDPIEWVGDGESPIVEVEGRLSLATGWHYFNRHTFSKAKCAFHALGGYYDDKGKFVTDENHAESVTLDGGVFAGIDAFHSDNQQAMGWRFYDCKIHECADREVVFADLRRGGDVLIRDLEILHSRLTVFKVRDYSPNNCRLVCRDFHRDRCTQANNYLTLFEYAGDEANQHDWTLEVSGFAAVHHAPFDWSRLYKVPGTLPRRNWKIDVTFSGDSNK